MRLLASLIFAVSWHCGLAQATPLKSFGDKDFGFEVGLPMDCRHAVSPGALEAVCAPSMTAAAARGLKAAGAWLFEVDYEEAPADAPAYSLDALRDEVPAMVCGSGDQSGVAITNLRQTADGPRKMFEADVSCPPMAMLALPERRAKARVIIAGQKRFRLIARTPADDAAKAAPTAEAFLDSFKLAD